jgi:ankyrin repeat protein
MSEPLHDAITGGNAAVVAGVLDANPELKARLNDPLPGGSFGETALLAAVRRANREVVDVLLRAGADINQKSHWWAGPFHVLDGAARAPWLPSYLIGRGAVPEIHHVVQLGMGDDVARMLAEDASLIHARGGDGQLPLHFAQTVGMAEYLVSRGADVDARDVDHESTAAQYMVRDRQPIARYLLRRGATADVLMAAALGDAELIRQLVDAMPKTIRMRVSREWFPMRDARAGGTIYTWTLGGAKGAHEIAREFGHDEALRVLMTRTPPSLKLAVACELEDAAFAEDLRGQGVAIEPVDQVRLVGAAHRRRTAVARMLLESGCAPGVVDEGATALHWAAYHGNADLVQALLAHGAPTDARDAQYHGTPRGWAEHGSQEPGPKRDADYPRVLEMLEVPTDRRRSGDQETRS